MSQTSIIETQRGSENVEVDVYSDVENHQFEVRSLKLKDQNGVKDRTEKKRISQKRKPTTPSSAMRSVGAGRRRMAETLKSGLELMNFSEGNNEAVVEMKYQNWLLAQKVARRDATIAFMEKERAVSIYGGSS